EGKVILKLTSPYFKIQSLPASVSFRMTFPSLTFFSIWPLSLVDRPRFLNWILVHHSHKKLATGVYSSDQDINSRRQPSLEQVRPPNLPFFSSLQYNSRSFTVLQQGAILFFAINLSLSQ